MKCGDIDTNTVLKFVKIHGGIGCHWFEAEYVNMGPRSVRNCMPSETPDKLVHAKMRKLISKGLIDGCPCGCRGDFELTEKGLERIEEETGL